LGPSLDTIRSPEGGDDTRSARPSAATTSYFGDRVLTRRKEHTMNEYRIRLIDRDGNNQYDHIRASSAQEAADIIRKEWKNCYIQWIALKVNDWE